MKLSVNLEGRYTGYLLMCSWHQKLFDPRKFYPGAWVSVLRGRCSLKLYRILFENCTNIESFHVFFSVGLDDDPLHYLDLWQRLWDFKSNVAQLPFSLTYLFCRHRHLVVYEQVSISNQGFNCLIWLWVYQTLVTWWKTFDQY